MAYLDGEGLSHLWLLIKQWISNQEFAKSADIPEGIEASSTTPEMDGTASAGSETKFARGDHRHPSDTSKQNLINSSNKLSADFISDGTTNKVFTSTEKTKLSNIDTSLLAPKASPEFSGTPTAPTASAGTNTTQIATTAFVTTAVANGIAGITGISYSVVTSLPQNGEAGVIYLVANSGSGTNSYDEYIWLGSSFEKIGTTDVDLSGYLQINSKISNGDIDAIIV